MKLNLYEAGLLFAGYFALQFLLNWTIAQWLERASARVESPVEKEARQKVMSWFERRKRGC